MHDVIDRLKHRARLLHRAAAAGEPAALDRLARLSELRGAPPAPTGVRRRHALAAVARELGFGSWLQAQRVLRGELALDYGDLLAPPECAAHWNVWSASYDEARAIRAQTGGFLLAFRRQFFVADEHHVRTLGLDPEDPDWERLDRDWPRSPEVGARARLYARLLQHRLGADRA